jgi:hypothetical protein
MRGIQRYLAVAGRVVRRLHVPAGLVDVDADEVERRGDRLQLLVRERRRAAAGFGQVRVGERPSSITVVKPASRSSYLTSESSLNIGRYMLMMITPTIAPTPIIISGSMIAVSEAIAASTSSS